MSWRGLLRKGGQVGAEVAAGVAAEVAVAVEVGVEAKTEKDLVPDRNPILLLTNEDQLRSHPPETEDQDPDQDHGLGPGLQLGRDQEVDREVQGDLVLVLAVDHLQEEVPPLQMHPSLGSKCVQREANWTIRTLVTNYSGRWVGEAKVLARKRVES